VYVVKDEPIAAATPRRSLDGNIYSLDALRDDEYLRKVLASSARLADLTRDASRDADNQRRFAALLAATEARSSDVYEYLRVLEERWDRVNFIPRGDRVVEV
jgi:hypothetical protein